MTAPLRRWLTTLLLVSALPVFANDSTDRYAEALQRLAADELSFEQLADWRGHRLYPHLVTHWVARYSDRVDADWFAQRIDRPGWQAAVWDVRQLWLEELARREDWQRYLDYDARWPGFGQPCQRFTALQASDRPIPDAALRELWLSAESLPDACDPFLDRLSQAEDFDDLIWQRQLLAFQARNGSMLRYLNSRYGEPEQRRRGERLLAIYNYPAGLFSQGYQGEQEWQQQLAVAAIDRLAYRDPEGAARLWASVLERTPEMSPALLQSASAELGTALAKLARPGAERWLALADPDQTDEAVQHWRLQVALAANDWAKIEQLYQGLGESLRTEGQWLYWSGMALRHLGDNDLAEQRLTQEAGERSYYGFLAAAALDRPAALNMDERPQIRSRAPLAEHPALKRALALHQAGDRVRAQIEWNLTLRDFDNDQLLEAAQLARHWNWYHKASQTAALSGRYGELSLRFPTPFADLVGELTATARVPPHWLYGIMRQESHFMTQARSPVGARGLMQLMPYTARGLAARHDLNYVGADDLDDPAVNITLGHSYLDEMQRRFGHPVYATAAYNAGPSRVNRWIDRYPSDLSIWVESIPFDETRHYVKSVLSYAQVYAMRDGQNWTLASWLNRSELASLND